MRKSVLLLISKIATYNALWRKFAYMSAVESKPATFFRLNWNVLATDLAWCG